MYLFQAGYELNANLNYTLEAHTIVKMLAKLVERASKLSHDDAVLNLFHFLINSDPSSVNFVFIDKIVISFDQLIFLSDFVLS